MKYNTISIKPTIDNEWDLQIKKSNVERVYEDTRPNAFGFYHAPETIDIPVAINKLKEVMIKSHESAIAQLQKSLDKLMKL